MYGKDKDSSVRSCFYVAMKVRLANKFYYANQRAVEFQFIKVKLLWLAVKFFEVSKYFIVLSEP